MHSVSSPMHPRLGASCSGMAILWVCTSDCCTPSKGNGAPARLTNPFHGIISGCVDCSIPAIHTFAIRLPTTLGLATVTGACYSNPIAHLMTHLRLHSWGCAFCEAVRGSSFARRHGCRLHGCQLTMKRWAESSFENLHIYLLTHIDPKKLLGEDGCIH
ncbi:hypothetical protein BS50DRAFT_324593 [Corynespora cassiicola Philippines]|uniref:Uncharacterized protein n=1 Tax=Corynespora cassiicola Philippines TaxID=1448308 RepID=A0A2T2NTN2_CORCC|nr:hypothetical protein BS50DRAFT_324593 [Corynespora cassiicola Philippines]